MPKPSQKHSTAFWLGTVARAADLLKPRNLIKDAVFWRCKVIFLNSKSINPKYSKQYSFSYFVHWRRKHVNHLCFLKRCCWPQNTGKLFEFSAYLISKIQILRIKRFFLLVKTVIFILTVLALSGSLVVQVEHSIGYACVFVDRENNFRTKLPSVAQSKVYTAARWYETQSCRVGSCDVSWALATAATASRWTHVTGVSRVLSAHGQKQRSASPRFFLWGVE